MIQEQAQSVPQFQSRISQLETELHQYRYETFHRNSLLLSKLPNRRCLLHLRTLSTFTTPRSQCTCRPDPAHQQLELSGDSGGKTGERLKPAARLPLTTCHHAESPSLLRLQMWNVCRERWRGELPLMKRRRTEGRGRKVPQRRRAPAEGTAVQKGSL